MGAVTSKIDYKVQTKLMLLCLEIEGVGEGVDARDLGLQTLTCSCTE